MSDGAANIHTAQLKDLCDFVRGVTFEQYEASQSPAEGSVPILRAGNIGADLLLDRDLVYVPESRVSREQLLQQGDSVICMSSGSALVVGKSAYLGRPWAGSAGAFCGIIRPRRAAVEPRWLSLWMHSDTFIGWRDSQARGANIQNLRFSELGSIPVRVPTLLEQKRIATKLDEQMAALASAQAALIAQREAATALRSAVLRTALDPATHPGWRFLKLGNVCDVVNGVGFPEHMQGRTDLPYPFIKVSDMNADGADVTVSSARNTVDEAILATLGGHAYPMGTVIFPKVGGALLTNKKRILGQPSCFDNNVMGLVPLDVDSRFLYMWFQGVDLRTLSNTQALPSVRQSVVAALEIPLPSRAEQCRIAEHLDGSMKRIDSMVASLDGQAAALDVLRTSLLDAAFSGQV